MPKGGICGGEAPRQPCLTEDGKCDLFDKKVMLAEAAEAELLRGNSESWGETP